MTCVFLRCADSRSLRVSAAEPAPLASSRRSFAESSAALNQDPAASSPPGGEKQKMQKTRKNIHAKLMWAFNSTFIDFISNKTVKK